MVRVHCQNGDGGGSWVHKRSGASFRFATDTSWHFTTLLGPPFLAVFCQEPRLSKEKSWILVVKHSSLLVCDKLPQVRLFYGIPCTFLLCQTSKDLEPKEARIRKERIRKALFPHRKHGSGPKKKDLKSTDLAQKSRTSFTRDQVC